MTVFNLADLFEAAADAWPEREALVAGAERRTFAALDERANRFAHHLRGAGIHPGEHVGILAHNRAEWVEAMLGCLKARMVPINVNYRYTAEELRYLFADAELRALVYEAGFDERVEATLDGVPSLRHLVVIDDDGDDAVPYETALRAADPGRGFGPRSPDDRYLVYTGGTTGLPKGVVWRQEDVYFALGGGIDPFTGERVGSPDEAVQKAKSNESPMRMFPLGPLMHLSGQWGTLQRLMQANTIVLYTGRSFDPDAIWKVTADEKVNVVLMSGDAMARPLADALERLHGSLDLSALFSVASGAAIFSPQAKRRFCELLPNAIVSDSVGSSEGGFSGMQTVSKDAADGIRVRPSPDTVVLDPSTWEPAVPGIVGKLARTGNIPLGYWRDPSNTQGTFVESAGKRWVVPGDDAMVEEDGTVVLLGRGSTCINTGGEKVFPEEVESALKEHPDVYDVLVVGVPDDRFGERVAAVVQPAGSASPSLDAIQTHCRQRLAGYKVPREVHLVERVERHPTGKPDYPWAKRVALSGD